jgi:hypothetical protein
VAIAVALAAKLAGEREPDSGLGGVHLCSWQVLLNVEVRAPFRGVDVVISVLGVQERA